MKTTESVKRMANNPDVSTNADPSALKVNVLKRKFDAILQDRKAKENSVESNANFREAVVQPTTSVDCTESSATSLFAAVGKQVLVQPASPSGRPESLTTDISPHDEKPDRASIPSDVFPNSHNAEPDNVTTPSKAFSECLFVEVFSGTAGLTCAIRKMGMQGIGVDHNVSKACKAPLIRLDLTKEHGQQILFEVLRRKNVMGVHLAPPCGTSSRAREIRRRGRFNPPPLRTERHPDGKPGLKGVHLKRVLLANQLYALTGRIVRFCIEHHISVSVENPARSHMWATRSFLDELGSARHTLLETRFHHCMMGSSRKKHTLLLHNNPHLKALQILCDNSHTHEPWGYNQGWATAQETEYPTRLCNMYADAFAGYLQTMGFQPSPQEASLSPLHVNSVKHNQVGSYKQPKGKTIPHLVREFQHVITFKGPPACLPEGKLSRDWTVPDNILQSHDPPMSVVPKNSRVLRSKFLGGENGELQAKEIAIGIHWHADDFVKQAIGKVHPREAMHSIPSILMQAIDRINGTSASQLAQERTANARKWMLRTMELREMEQNLKSQMDPHCSAVLCKKNLLVYKEMMQQCGYGDRGLFRDVCKGFKLLGDLQPSNVFPSKPSFATLTEEQVVFGAEFNRKALVSSAFRPMDDDIKRGVYEATVKELESGWLEGPFSVADLPKSAVLTRRFGIKQTSTGPNGEKIEKIRPIDDFTESLVNLSNGSQESIIVQGIDFIMAAIRYRLRRVEPGSPGSRLQAKTVDLRKAYKQLPISRDSLGSSFLGVVNPSSNTFEVYRCKVLPFGARAAVNGFCRVSHSLWYIGVAIFQLHWSVYFDDYMIIETEASAKHTAFIADNLFAMLGWETSDEKGGKFAACARALGVVFDFADSAFLRVKVCNSESRKTEVGAAIQQIIDKKFFRRAELETLRGRLVFAESQTFGRLSKRAMRELSRAIHGGGSCQLDRNLEDALVFLKDRILCSPPRVMDCSMKRVLHLYTDACQEESFSGIGGLAYDAQGIILGYFSLEVKGRQLKKINVDKKATVIAELEALAVLVGLRIFCEGQGNWEIVSFIDNEATLAAMIKADSAVKFLGSCSALVAEVEVQKSTDLWFERVASNSNPADLPSRGKVEHLHQYPVLTCDLDGIIDQVSCRMSHTY